jgi:HEPN domain-containing protein
MQRDPLVQEWCTIAKQDLESAQYLRNMKPMPLEVIGFLCQQAVEKYMKAFLVHHGIEPEKTHDLVFLLKQCQDFDAAFMDIFEIANNLNKYAVQTRYPYPHQLDEAQVLHSLD